MNKCKMNAVALGMALGIIWGVSLLLMGLVAYYATYGSEFVAAVGTVYLGYQPSILGAFVGGLIGFVDAFIAGALIAWLYNLFGGCKGCCNKE